MYIEANEIILEAFQSPRSWFEGQDGQGRLAIIHRHQVGFFERTNNELKKLAKFSFNALNPDSLAEYTFTEVDPQFLDPKVVEAMRPPARISRKEPTTIYRCVTTGETKHRFNILLEEGLYQKIRKTAAKLGLTRNQWINMQLTTILNGETK